jgi:hypothetical protein
MSAPAVPSNLYVAVNALSLSEVPFDASAIERNTRFSRPSCGPCIPGDPILDPDSLFVYETGLNPNTMGKIYRPKIAFKEIIVRGLAAGQSAGTFLEILYHNGGWDKEWIPAIAAYSEYAIFGDFIAINYATSGAAINVYPFF